MEKMERVRRVIFSILGMVCILFAGHVCLALPYLLGGAMIAVGSFMAVGYFLEKKFLSGASEELAYGSILFIMGLAFLVRGSQALIAVGITWAMIGIRKAAKSMNRAIRQIYQKEHYIVSVLEFLIRITLSLILLFDPFEKMSAHIVLLGLEMLAVSIPFTRVFSRVTSR